MSNFIYPSQCPNHSAYALDEMPKKITVSLRIFKNNAATVRFLKEVCLINCGGSGI